jgi:hypothetical protein
MKIEEFKQYSSEYYYDFTALVRAYIADYINIHGGDKSHDTMDDYNFGYLLLAVIINNEYECSETLKKYCSINYTPNDVNLNDVAELYSYGKRFIIPGYNTDNLFKLSPTKFLIYYLQHGNCINDVLKSNGLSVSHPGGNKTIDQPKLDELLSKLKILSEVEDNKYYSETLATFCKNMQPDAISYFEYMGRVYNLLTEQEENIKIIGVDDSSKYIVSAFIALFLFKDTSEKTNYSDATLSFFKSKNLTLDNILELINLKIDGIDKINPAETLKKQYKAFTGNSGSVYSFMKNIFESSTTNHVVIKKLLTELGVDYKIIDELKNILYDISNNQIAMTRKDYNDSVKLDVIKYLEDVYRIYKVLVSANKKIDINNDVIEEENDYISIAFLLKSYQMNGNVSKYFISNGINIKDIDTITGIPVDMSKLNEVEIDDKEIVLKIYSFLKYINSNIDKINIEDIEYLITNSDNANTKVLNRLFFTITGNTLPVDYSKEVKSFIKELEKKEFDSKVEKLFHGLDSSLYNYLTYVSCYFTKLQKLNLQGKNAEAISLILALYNSTYYNYLNSEHKVNFSNIKSEYKAEISSSSSLNIDVIEEYFLPFIFEGNNKDKKREDITIEDVVSNAFNKDLNDSFQFEQFLSRFELNSEIFANMDENMAAKKREKEITEAKSALSNFGAKSTLFREAITVTYKIYEDLIKNKDKLKISEMSDIDKVAPLIAFFLMDDNKYKAYFENEGINLKYILDFIGYSLEDLKSIDFKDVDECKLFEKYRDFMNWHTSPGYTIEKEYTEKLEKVNLFNYDYLNMAAFGRRIIDTVFSSSNLFYRMIPDVEVYKRIKKCFEEEPSVVYLIPAEEIIEDLQKQINSEVNVDKDDPDSITEFLLTGDSGLSKYSEYIQAQITEIARLMNNDNTIENIDEMVGQLYIDTPVKQGLITRIFKSEKTIERKVNSNVLTKLNDELELSIENLNIQVKKYREIFKVIKLYIKAITKYKNLSLEYKNYLESKVKPKYEGDEEYYSDLLEITQLIDSLNNKIVNYDRTLVLMKQQQLQIIQTLNNHMVTKEALQSSKNDIIPIIGSEMLFRLGTATEANALELSNNLVALFKNVISGNSDAARRSLEMIESSNLPKETVDKLIADFSTYLEETDEDTNGYAKVMKNQPKK